MKIVYGTGNRAKIDVMRQSLAPLGLEIPGICDVLASVPPVDETGNDPLENASLKAHAYYHLIGAPVFSCDSGLFIDGLSPAQQPGVHVRTRNGKSMSDEEMIDYYASLARQCGGFCTARYRNAICLILDQKTVFRHMGDDISGDAFILSSIPHEKRRSGFPLDSLSVHLPSGKYYYDLDAPRVSPAAAGFRAFFERALASAAR